MTKSIALIFVLIFIIAGLTLPNLAAAASQEGPPDTTESPKQPPSTDDSRDVMLERARRTWDTDGTVQRTMDEHHFDPLVLKGYYPGGDSIVYVPGDIKTRVDWNSTSALNVRIWNGEHAHIMPEQLKELKRRKDILGSLPGITSGPSPTPEEVEADARAEDAYPRPSTVEEFTLIYKDPEGRARINALPAGSVVVSYKKRGSYCLVRADTANIVGWISAYKVNCEGMDFPDGYTVQQAIPEVSHPPEPGNQLQSVQYRSADEAEKNEPKLPRSVIRPLVVFGGLLLTGLFNLVSRIFTKSKHARDPTATTVAMDLTNFKCDRQVSGPPPPPISMTLHTPPPQPPFAPNPPPPKAPDKSFIVVRNGQQFGPYTSAKTQQYLASGHVLPTDLGRRDGEQQWLPISQLLVAERPQSSLPEPAAKILIGEKYAYYEAKWASLESRNSKLSWNWAAFFFGPSWLAYRKMHAYAWAYITVVAVDSLVELFLERELIPSTVFLVMNLMFAIQGNYWYKTHVFKRVGEILRNTPQSADFELASRGGTSMGAAVVVFFVLGILSYGPVLFDQH